MRVLVRTCNRGVIGGIETYLGGVLPLLRDAGVTLALSHEREATAGARLIDRDVPQIERFPPADVATTLARIAAWRPDVVLENGGLDLVLPSRLIATYPCVWYVHVHTGTCISGTKLRQFPVPTPCERTLGPGCLVRYLPCRCGGLSQLTALRGYRTARDALGVLRTCRRVLVASEWMKADLVRHELPSERVGVLPYFPDGGTAPELPPSPGPAGDVIMMARMVPAKGAHVLIDAMPVVTRRLGRPVRLVLVGNGSDLPALKSRAVRAGVPVTFDERAPLPREERERLLRGAALLVQPSLWPEPFGLVGMEAGALGVPSVAFDSGGPRDWCIPGETGEIAPASPPTAAGLADAIVRALHDPAHHQRLREGAYAFARRHSAAAHVAALLAELRSVMRS
jgi:glycosyltransferase involved in cell wall biosynthesis